jgi:hypothetical protein
VAIPSPEVDIIAEAARTHKVYLEVGVIEKEGGTLYCTALLFGRDGEILLKHRKVVKLSLSHFSSFLLLFCGTVPVGPLSLT